MIWEEDDGDGEVLVEALDRVELQLGGGASDAINFEFIPYSDHGARHVGVHRRVFTTRLSQSFDATANRGNIAEIRKWIGTCRVVASAEWRRR